jgi:O-antigen/teichoic acid export membrane protein
MAIAFDSTSVKRNVLANYLGQGAQAVVGLAFIPLYIKYLGIEAYGLIGIFGLLQAWLALLDLGMRPALGREMARFTAGALSPQSIRDLLRSVELIGVALAAALALGIWAASGWLAFNWVTSKHLPTTLVAHSFALMGAVTALRFVEEIYVSSIAGLQRQRLQNALTAGLATARGVGAVCVLALVSPTLKAFFLWQALMSLISVAVFARAIYEALPTAPLPARFSGPALKGTWRFAAGMMAITLLALLLTQVDKILLARLLTLESFAYYTLAGSAVNGLYMLMAPIAAACYPRFTQLLASGDTVALQAIYHRSAQLVSVLMGSAAVVLALFSDTVLSLWTSSPVLAQHVAPLLALLAVGALFNGLTGIPYQLQIASGWTSLMVKVNIIAVSILVPSLLWIVPSYGAMGAARVWVTLNAGYVMFAIPLMHRRLLPADKWLWYRNDVAAPLAAATATAFLWRWLIPHGLGKLGELSVLSATSISSLVCAALAAPAVRTGLSRFLLARIRTLHPRLA